MNRQPEQLAAELIGGDRGALARAITLIESSRAADAPHALALLDAVLAHTGNAIRVGVSGVPGVGKSTYIEALGMRLVEQGHRVAVLAVDPSSALSGGSLLGDKTRMTDLARSDAAFIRPSPGGRTLGGVSRRTREAMLLCEAAGHDVVLVETIGVGQSEVAVSSMVDVFLLLALAGAGDELQGIKRGITEIADLVVVNKADGDNANRAAAAAKELAAALAMLRASPLAIRDSHRPVLTCSARTGVGIDDTWRAVTALHASAESDGRLAERRQTQQTRWMEDAVEDLLRARLDGDARLSGERAQIETLVESGMLSPLAAAHRIVDAMLVRTQPSGQFDTHDGRGALDA